MTATRMSRMRRTALFAGRSLALPGIPDSAGETIKKSNCLAKSRWRYSLIDWQFIAGIVSGRTTSPVGTVEHIYGNYGPDTFRVIPLTLTLAHQGRGDQTYKVKTSLPLDGRGRGGGDINLAFILLPCRPRACSEASLRKKATFESSDD